VILDWPPVPGCLVDQLPDGRKLTCAWSFSLAGSSFATLVHLDETGFPFSRHRTNPHLTVAGAIITTATSAGPLRKLSRPKSLATTRSWARYVADARLLYATTSGRLPPEPDPRPWKTITCRHSTEERLAVARQAVSGVSGVLGGLIFRHVFTSRQACDRTGFSIVPTTVPCSKTCNL